MIHFFYDSCLMFFQFLIPGIFLGVIYDIFRFIRIARNDNPYYLLKEIKRRYFPEKENTISSLHRSKREFVWVFIEDVFFFLILSDKLFACGQPFRTCSFPFEIKNGQKKEGSAFPYFISGIPVWVIGQNVLMTNPIH